MERCVVGLVLAAVLVTVHGATIHNKYTPTITEVAQNLGSSTTFRVKFAVNIIDDEYHCDVVGAQVPIGDVDSTRACSKTVVNNCIYTCEEEDRVRNGREGDLDDFLDVLDAELESVLTLPGGGLSTAIQMPTDGVCGFYQGLDYSDDDYFSKLGGTDLSIQVTARPAPEAAAIAYGAACVVDSGTGRPVLGHININGATLNDLLNLDDPANSDPMLRMLFMREVMHVLGFSTHVFPYYPTNPVSAGAFTGTAALDAAQSHFGCDTLASIEMEEFLYHDSLWEKRILQGELMTGDIDENSVLSLITLGALEDSGWYDFDEATAVANSFAQSLTWGAAEGCPWVEGSCLDWVDACSTGNPTCTSDGSGRQCDLEVYSADLPVEFQYFSGNPTLGGTDPLMDYCPMMTDGSMSCLTPLSDNSDEFFSPYFEQTFLDARCFSSDLRADDDVPFTGQVGICYRTQCTDTNTMYVALANAWLICTSGISLSVDGFSGAVECPTDLSSDEWCGSLTETVSWPDVSTISPQVGPVSGGVVLSIIGNSFPRETRVLIGGVPCLYPLFFSESEITCVTPAGLPLGDANIQLIDANGYTIVSVEDVVYTVVEDQEPVSANALYDPTVDEQFDIVESGQQALIDAAKNFWNDLEEASEGVIVIFFFAFFGFIFLFVVCYAMICCGPPLPKKELDALPGGFIKSIAKTQYNIQEPFRGKQRMQKAQKQIIAMQQARNATVEMQKKDGAGEGWKKE